MSTPRPAPPQKPPLCQATWWHAELDRNGQRVKVNHLCERPAGHTGWHTCTFHKPVDRTMPGGSRVTEGTTHG